MSDSNNNNEFNFEEPEVSIPVVHVETDMFSADMYELYELPFEMVLNIMGTEGPEQMEVMADAFRLAIVNPRDTEKMDGLSFNELATAMFQWYKLSNIRVKPMRGVSDKRTRIGDIAGSGVIEEILETISVIEEMMKDDGDNASEKKDLKPRLNKPLNDPGDGINPFES